MPDEPLSPATREDLVSTLSYALRFDERGKPVANTRDYIAGLAAARLVQHLEASGFVIMKKPPAKGHSAGD